MAHDIRNAAFAAAVLALAGGPAAAQTSSTTPAPSTDIGAKPGTLSDKLSATKGVIAPTGDVDPAMHRAAPQTGTMPVIKPGTLAPGTAK